LHAAVGLRPDLAEGFAALGQFYASHGETEKAEGPLQQALQMNWTDSTTARALFQVLKSLGRNSEIIELINQRRLLAKAAPQSIRPEAWFQDDSGSSTNEDSSALVEISTIESARTYTVNINGTIYPIRCPTNHSLDTLIEEIFVNQAYPPLPFLRDARVIMDIGANVGCATILFRSYYRQARILSFEPDPKNFDFLRANAGHLTNVHLFAYGLYDRELEVDLFQGSGTGTTNSVGNSTHNSKQSSKVTIRRASNVLAELLIDQVDIAKLDTEGAEVPILQDLAYLLHRTSAVLVEYHSEEDRREIDRVLSNRFLLFKGLSKTPHRGTLAYVSREIIGRRTGYNRLKITRPLFQSGNGGGTGLS
jgi:FkbM family methyltransferase